ncbi:MLO-like protein 13 [Fagus crenata]
MLPCKKGTVSASGSEHYSNLTKNNRRRLLSEDTNSGHCLHEGKVPLLSLEALHHLHIFIFVLAVVHVIFCVTTMFLGGYRIRQWKGWEESEKGRNTNASEQHEFVRHRAIGYWRNAAIISWMIAFFKQFYGSVTKSDYIALRQGFIKEHCPSNSKFDFHKYMVRRLEVDFKKVVSISWYLWLFVVVFLLLNVAGWHSYFWLSFLPLILLLLVGAKLEHIITRLAQEVVERKTTGHGQEAQQVTEMNRDNHEVHNTAERNAKDHETARVKPSDKHFWFSRPALVLDLIQFILFQNSFEIAFFFWILCTYGFDSCIIEKPGFIITRLIMGVIVQVLCSYSTLPLYAIVTQMGSAFKKGIFEEFVGASVTHWVEGFRKRRDGRTSSSNKASQIQMQKMDKESPQNAQISEQAIVVIEETGTSITELPSVDQLPFSLS